MKGENSTPGVFNSSKFLEGPHSSKSKSKSEYQIYQFFNSNLPSEFGPGLEEIKYNLDWSAEIAG